MLTMLLLQLIANSEIIYVNEVQLNAKLHLSLYVSARNLQNDNVMRNSGMLEF